MARKLYPAARPLADELFFAERMQMLVGPYGGDYLVYAGEFGTPPTCTTEMSERTAPDTGSRVAVDRRTDVVKVGYTIAGALAQATDWMKEIKYSSEVEVLTQLADAAATKTFLLVKIGRIYDLECKHPTITGVNNGAVIDYEEGEDYEIDLATGRIEFLKDLATVTVEYTVPARTDKRFRHASKPTKYFKVVFRQSNDMGDDTVFPKCMIRQDGSFAFGGDGSAFGNVGISIKVVSDPNSPAGLELGWSDPIEEEDEE